MHRDRVVAEAHLDDREVVLDHALEPRITRLLEPRDDRLVDCARRGVARAHEQDPAAADHRLHLLDDGAGFGEQRARSFDHAFRLVEPTEPLEQLGAHAQRLAGEPQAVGCARGEILGDCGRHHRAGEISRAQQPVRAADRDVGEPARVAFTQRLQVIDVVGVAREIAAQPVRELAARIRLAAPGSRRRGRRDIAERALELERPREMRDGVVGIGGGHREPAGAQPERGGRGGLAAVLEVRRDHGGRLLATGEESRGEQPADPRVGLALRAQWHRVVDDLADEAARELELAFVAARADEHAGGRELFERVAIAVVAEQLLDDARADHAVHRRGEPHGGTGPRAQPIDARERDVARARRDLGRAGVVAAALGGLAHRLRELLDEQRVAAAARDHRGDVGRGRRGTEAIGDQRAQLGADEILDDELAVDARRRDALEPRRQHDELGSRRGRGERVAQHFEARADPRDGYPRSR